jgi:hypothetical protein
MGDKIEFVPEGDKASAEAGFATSLTTSERAADAKMIEHYEAENFRREVARKIAELQVAEAVGIPDEEAIILAPDGYVKEGYTDDGRKWVLKKSEGQLTVDIRYASVN